MSQYSHLSKEELVSLLESRDKAFSDNQSVCNLLLKDNIKQVIHKVLVLLFNSEEQDSIEKSMKIFLDFFDSDWGYVALFDKEEEEIKFICEVTSEWVLGKNKSNLDLTYEKIPWTVKQLMSGKDIIIQNTDQLPKEASTDKIQVDKQHILSLFILPLYFHNEVRGFIGFDTVRSYRLWTEQEREDIHIVARIFSIIIERKLAQSEREESRKRLSELSAKFQQFFEHLPLGVELYDADGFMINNNESDTKIFNASRESLLGINIFNNPNIPFHIREEIKQGKELFDFPLVYNFDKVRDENYFNSETVGWTKYLSVSGLTMSDSGLGKMGYLFIVSDETEDHLKTEQTRNHLATMKAALLSGHSLIGEYDIKNEEMFIDPELNDYSGNNIFFDYIRRRTYIPLSELKAMTFFENEDTNNYGLFEKIIDGKSNNCSITCHTLLGGETVWIRINAQAYQKGEDGITNRIICYITNITEEKLLEEKLQVAEEDKLRSEMEKQKAQEADKLKSAFLANMSHEIRTPLNAIVGFSSILAETEEPDEKEGYLDIINQNNELLLHLITDILDFSKIESGKLDYMLTNTSIKKICFEQYKIFSLRTLAHLSLIYDMNTLPDYILWTDPKRVTQVISNMLSNAFKYTEMGSITLAYHVVDEHLKIEVCDTGIGIEEKNRDSIFQRFVQVDNFKQGIGLGLPICKTIIEALNGEIGVESEFGKGSRFWFTLPLNPETILTKSF